MGVEVGRDDQVEVVKVAVVEEVLQAVDVFLARGRGVDIGHPLYFGHVVRDVGFDEVAKDEGAGNDDVRPLSFLEG